MRGAIVTDANNRVALAAARSLARGGIPVRLCVQQDWRRAAAAAFRSRAASGRFLLPTLADPDRWAAALARRLGPGDLLLPVSTNSLLAALDRRDRLGGFLPFWPEAAVVRRANHTPTALLEAERLGIAVPGAGGDFPRIVKLPDDEGLFLPPEARYRIVRDEAEQERARAELGSLRPDPVVQRFVRGTGLAVSVLFDATREPRAVFVHRRIREYPRRGGPSSLCESVRDPEAVEAALTLLRAFRWTGPAQVEFRREEGTGRLILMEINPRLWGTLPLAIWCGVDFPLWIWGLARDGRVPRRPPDYPVGVRMAFRWLDLAGWIRTDWYRTAPAWGVLRDLLDPCLSDGLHDRRDPWPGILWPLRGGRSA